MRYYSDKTFTDLIREQERIENIAFEDCVFENCKFSECTLVDCMFAECTFSHCSMADVRSINSHMAFTRFIQCALVGIDWQNWQSSGSISFPLQTLKKCFLKYNIFSKMQFRKFDFMQSSIVHSTFSQCRLSECDFNGCDLKDTEYSDCDLQKSDFRKASGYNIDPTVNKIRGAKFSYPDAVNLLRAFHITVEK